MQSWVVQSSINDPLIRCRAPFANSFVRRRSKNGAQVRWTSMRVWQKEVNENAPIFRAQALPFYSRRRWKRIRSSPSTILIKALRQTGSPSPPTPVSTKHDLSYRNARGPIPDNRTAKSPSRRTILRSPTDPRRLQTVLATFLRSPLARDATRFSVNPTTTRSLRPPPFSLPPASRHVLAARGYDGPDLSRWQYILRSGVNKAAQAILSTKDHGIKSNSGFRPLPTFVFLQFLRRPRLSPFAVRCLITHTFEQWSYFTLLRRLNSSNPDSTGQSAPNTIVSPPMDPSSTVILVIRLLRHARAALPEATVSVAKLFVELLTIWKENGMFSVKEQKRGQTLSRITFLCNRFLRLLSLPSPFRPFRNAPIRSRAQFDVLRWMAKQRPVIPITREGYRAVVSVQLASTKSHQDVDWANLKMKTWPPFKEDKLGLDSEKTPEYGVSQALEAINHARRAGYGSKEWEKVCEILAGWDTDRSPTIQTRALRVWSGISAEVSKQSAQRMKSIWAARIEATRTPEEAWACFLSYEDANLGAHQVVYLAMLRKLAARVYDQSTTPGGRPQIMAGDSREVFPIPASPKERTYVRRGVPTMDQLAEEMDGKGVKPSGECLDFLVSHAPSLEQGLKYLGWGLDRKLGIDSSILQRPEEDATIQAMSPGLFTAWIELLCRLLVESSSESERDSVLRWSCERHGQIQLRERTPLYFIFRMLKARGLSYPPPWQSLLSAIVRRQQRAGIHEHRTDFEDSGLTNWNLMRKVLDRMKCLGIPLSLGTFETMCRGASLGAQEALRLSAIPRSFDEAEWRHNQHAIFRPLQQLFNKVMGTRSASVPNNTLGGAEVDMKVPRLLTTPDPFMLHVYARATGFLRRWDGILKMLAFMNEYQPEIEGAAQQTRNGSQQLRKTFMAIRAFSERPLKNAEGDISASEAPELMLTKIKERADCFQDGAYWPSDDEVDGYCWHGLSYSTFPDNSMRMIDTC